MTQGKSGAGETPREMVRQAWLVTALLGLLYFINFLDKSVIGLAAVQIIEEYNLTPAEFGLLSSVFFIFFVPMQMVGGLLADKYPSSTILLIMAIVWSISMIPMILPTGFVALLMSRVLLGAGEGPTAPVAIHALYKWFPDARRAVPNAVYTMGPPAAMVIGAPVLVWLIADHGWRFSFLVLGLLSAVWALIWLVVGREGPIAAHRNEVGPTPSVASYLSIIRSRTFLGCFLLGFPSYFGLTIMLAWMPHFLEAAVGLDTKSVSWAIAGAWGIVGIGPLIVSLISQRMTERGFSAKVARGWLSGGLFAFSGLILIAAPTLPISTGVQAAMLIVGLPLGVVVNPLLFTLLGQITPIRLRGGTVGIFGTMTAPAGLLAPLAMGFAIQEAATELEGYSFGFTCFGIIALICGVGALILIDPDHDRLRWGAETARL